MEDRHIDSAHDHIDHPGALARVTEESTIEHDLEPGDARSPMVAAPAAATEEAKPPPVSRKVRRRSRRSRPRSRTIAMKRLTREELRLGALLNPPVDIPRPTTREECCAEARPCPWVACKHHLYLDVNPETGSIKINFPDLEPWELKHTCALDVAERGGITLEEVGEIMNLTRERIRQVEVRGLLKLKMASPSPEELGADLLRPRDDLD
jgi:Sigma-70, region 4